MSVCGRSKRAKDRTRRRRGHHAASHQAARGFVRAHQVNRAAFEKFQQRLDAALLARTGNRPSPSPCAAASASSHGPSPSDAAKPAKRRPARAATALAAAFGAAGMLALWAWQMDLGRSLRVAMTPREDVRVVVRDLPAAIAQAPGRLDLETDRPPSTAVIARDADAVSLQRAADGALGSLQAKKAELELPAASGPQSQASSAHAEISVATMSMPPTAASTPMPPTAASGSMPPTAAFQSPTPAPLDLLRPGAVPPLRSDVLEADPGRCSLDDPMPVQPVARPAAQSEEFGRALAAAALRQTTEFVVYTNKYRKLAYPMGDVPALFGVCTDVVIRAYRTLGVDLQALIHAARIGSPDTSIAHRRTFTLRRYFASRGASVPVSDFAEDYLPGDIVTYDRPQNSGSRDHIAIVTGIISRSGRPMIVHNRGWGPQLEDALFVDRITGHYRYRGRTDPLLPEALRMLRTKNAETRPDEANGRSGDSGHAAARRGRIKSGIVKRASLRAGKSNETRQ